jgi:hypothetical protein
MALIDKIIKLFQSAWLYIYDAVNNAWIYIQHIIDYSWVSIHLTLRNIWHETVDGATQVWLYCDGLMNTLYDPIQRSVKDDPIKFFTIANSMIFLIGAVFTVIQIRAVGRSRKNAALSDIFARLAEHNNQTINDPYKRKAVEQFSTLSIPPHSEVDSLTDEEISKLYWGTRAFHIGLINLLAQVWLLSGRHRRLRQQYEGWENLAKVVVSDLKDINPGSKPLWYRKACTDLWGPISQSRVYPPGFAKWLNRIS